MPIGPKILEYFLMEQELTELREQLTLLRTDLLVARNNLEFMKYACKEEEQKCRNLEAENASLKNQVEMLRIQEKQTLIEAITIIIREEEERGNTERAEELRIRFGLVNPEEEE